MTDNRTTERLRALLDERGVEHYDEYVKSGMPYCDGYEGTYWYNDTFGYVEPIRPKPNTLGSHPELTIHDCTPEQAIAATLGSERERELELLVKQLWYLVNHRSGYGYAAALESIEELGIEVEQ